MKKITLIIFVLIFLFWLPQIAEATEAAGSAMLKNEALGIENSDPRTQKLAQFLTDHQSPLTDYAAYFVEKADQYQLDWKLVPAITGVESTFGKNIPSGSFNAYGWANGQYRFQSWEESIERVIVTLKEKYIDRGLDTPNKIGPVYAPPSNTWADKVTYFMKKIECFGSPDCLSGLRLTL